MDPTTGFTRRVLAYWKGKIDTTPPIDYKSVNLNNFVAGDISINSDMNLFVTIFILTSFMICIYVMYRIMFKKK